MEDTDEVVPVTMPRRSLFKKSALEKKQLLDHRMKRRTDACDENLLTEALTAKNKNRQIHHVLTSPENIQFKDVPQQEIPLQINNVLDKVGYDQRIKMEQAFMHGFQRPKVNRAATVPVIKPLPKPRQRNISATWQKIMDPKYQLEDPEIELAMLLIKNNHPDIGGLQPVTVALAEGYKKPSGKFIQIVNVKGEHWITLSNISCKSSAVNVFDSWKRTLHWDTKAAIMAIVDADTNNQIAVEVCRFQKQRNDSDCGLFAVAAMVALAHGSDPSKLIWDLRTLRSHFVDCLNLSKLTPFPLYQSTDSARVLLPKTFTLTVCTSCHVTICDNDDTQCKTCKVKPW